LFFQKFSGRLNGLSAKVGSQKSDFSLLAKSFFGRFGNALKTSFLFHQATATIPNAEDEN